MVEASDFLDHLVDIIKLAPDLLFDILLLRRQFFLNGTQVEFQGQEGMAQFVM